MPEFLWKSLKSSDFNSQRKFEFVFRFLKKCIFHANYYYYYFFLIFRVTIIHPRCTFPHTTPEHFIATKSEAERSCTSVKKLEREYSKSPFSQSAFSRRRGNIRCCSALVVPMDYGQHQENINSFDCHVCTTRVALASLGKPGNESNCCRSRWTTRRRAGWVFVANGATREAIVILWLNLASIFASSSTDLLEFQPKKDDSNARASRSIETGSFWPYLQFCPTMMEPWVWGTPGDLQEYLNTFQTLPTAPVQVAVPKERKKCNNDLNWRTIL